MKKTVYTLKFVLLFATLIVQFSFGLYAQKKAAVELKDEMDITTLQEGYRKKTYSIEDITQAYLDRIQAVDKNGSQLNSVLTINPDAIAIAKALDKELKAGKWRGPLHGVPVLLKDNIDTKDKMPTTAGSRALANSFPLQDSFVAQKLREAGAVIIGKTNLSEWANFRGAPSTSGWSGLGGQTKNAYDVTRNPCGSSSGSAVAVAANLALFAIGTETNGSIVCPAHANGIVGLKPTVGLISRGGIIPISFTQDTAGPMARTVKDAAIVLGWLTGVDTRDSKTAASATMAAKDYASALDSNSLKGKRIGVYVGVNGKNKEVDALYQKAIEDMKAQGATLVEIPEITPPEVNMQSFTVMLYEYKQGLNDYFKSLGPNAAIKSVDELIEFNKKDPVELKYFNQLYLEIAQGKTDLNTEEYKKALEAMRINSQEKGIDKVMNDFKIDVIIAPTGTPAWVTDSKKGDQFTFGTSGPAAHSGYPSITVPMGYVEGLPVGISFVGKAWSEAALLNLAYAYEQNTKHRHAPSLIGN
nr:amidase [uncultured Flavobacterium sp.]